MSVLSKAILLLSSQQLLEVWLRRGPVRQVSFSAVRLFQVGDYEPSDIDAAEALWARKQMSTHNRFGCSKMNHFRYPSA